MSIQFQWKWIWMKIVPILNVMLTQFSKRLWNFETHKNRFAQQMKTQHFWSWNSFLKLNEICRYIIIGCFFIACIHRNFYQLNFITVNVPNADNQLGLNDFLFAPDSAISIDLVVNECRLSNEGVWTQTHSHTQTSKLIIKLEKNDNPLWRLK